MIYVSNEQTAIEMLRSNTSDYFCYQLKLLNGQTHEIFSSTPLINASYSGGNYLFNIDLSELNNGCFYYQLFAGHNEDEINTLVETGILEKGGNKNNTPIEYNSNKVNKTYNG